jgi:hypothetical protein
LGTYHQYLVSWLLFLGIDQTEFPEEATLDEENKKASIIFAVKVNDKKVYHVSQCPLP